MAAPRQTIIAGPWGRPGGSDWDDGFFKGVSEIHLKHGRTDVDGAIGFFQAIYLDSTGQPIPGPTHGNPPASSKSVDIKLVPGERIVSVSGYTGRLADQANDVVRSLTFQTNRNIYGPFGVQKGIEFNFPVDSNFQVVGFKGATGEFLNALGLHVSS